MDWIVVYSALTKNTALCSTVYNTVQYTRTFSFKKRGWRYSLDEFTPTKKMTIFQILE